MNFDGRDYNIDFFNADEIDLLREDWLLLQKGRDMTYFQFFEWYKMLAAFSPKNSRNFETVFVTVSNRSGRRVLIAPLWVIKRTFRLVNRKGVYLFGRRGFSDYLNLIYDEFDAKAFECLVEAVREKYGVDIFTFELLRESTSLYGYLSSHYTFIKRHTTTCVQVLLPSTKEEYYKSLSKNSRQNIRTAINRMEKSSVSLTWSFDDKKADIGKLIELRQRRVNQKNRRSAPISIKDRLISMMRYSPPKYLPLKDDNEKHLMTARDGGTVCAFFSYGINPYNDGIAYMMQVGLDEAYSRYSPGLLLAYRFICEMIETGEIRYVDFTKGTEPYKYALGGKDHFIHSVVFKV